MSGPEDNWASCPAEPMVWAEDRLPKKLCLTRGWGGVEGVRGALWAGRIWWTNYDGWVVNFEDGEAFPPTDHRAGYRLDPPFNAHRLLGRQDGSFLQHQFPLQHPRPVAGSLLNLCRHPHLPPPPPRTSPPLPSNLCCVCRRRTLRKFSFRSCPFH